MPKGYRNALHRKIKEVDPLPHILIYLYLETRERRVGVDNQLNQGGGRVMYRKINKVRILPSQARFFLALDKLADNTIFSPLSKLIPNRCVIYSAG